MRRMPALGVALAVAVMAMGARAAEGPAVSRVREACATEAKEGFKVREHFWTGTAKTGERQSLKHQLFRGNEYWFWLAGSDDAVVPSLKVYDAKGRPVDVETKSEDGRIAVRLLPPRTGSYTVVFVFSVPEGGKDTGAAAEWAMTYGYR